MKTNRKGSPARRSLAACLGMALTAAVIGTGCLDYPIDTIEPRDTWTVQYKQSSSIINKIDLLLMIDNSASMADKQAILSEAVPRLVKGLLNPPCIGDDNNPVANQPTSPLDICPQGSVREFQAVPDVHIGIVTSSLGGHGSDSCPITNTGTDSTGNPTKNDAGHLIFRQDASMPDQKLNTTYKDQGFLAWDPKQALTPPGDADLDMEVTKLTDMVKGVGQIGCGYESQLESWYRFLVDPHPYNSISLDSKGNAVVSAEDDQVLLNQRAEFLRPDSMVAILMLTDENDCSVREDHYFPVINQILNPANPSKLYALPRPRAECASDPNAHCCAECGHAPSDCADDPTCSMDNGVVTNDPTNLRCFDQKRRFGIDFLYPIDRYVNALTSGKVPTRDGQMVDNPLFPPDPTGTLNARTPQSGLVYLAGIVGVPWQDIAKDPTDLKQGLLDSDGLSARDPKTNLSRWDLILGDPKVRDPLMIESIDARSGTSPVVNAAIAPTSATSPTANPVNGHEWNTTGSDLQYACIFALKDSDVRDCSKATDSCDCAGADTNKANNPLCQDASGAYTQVQRRAKGYPGLRELSVLQGLGAQGIVASVCPAQVNTPTDRDYGYNPAIGALIDRLKIRLSDQCLNRPLKPTSNDQVKCVVIEASQSKGATCCTGAGRSEVPDTLAGAVQDAKNDPITKGDDCFCAINQLSGDALNACQHDTHNVPTTAMGEPVDGWCYVDGTVGDPTLVAKCPKSEPQKLRFVGAGQPVPNSYMFITCTSDSK